MEPFLSTLPPFVHDYLNKYPPTECFNILKDLICFAVLYSNNREHTNLLSLELLEKGADQAIMHKPYVSSTLTLSSLASISSVASPIHSAHDLASSSPPSDNSKMIPSPPASVIKHHQQQKSHADHQHHQTQHHQEYSTSLGEAITSRNTESITPAQLPIQEQTTLSPPRTTILSSNRKSTMPFTFPDWWAHPDANSTHGLADTPAGKAAPNANTTTKVNTNTNADTNANTIADVSANADSTIRSASVESIPQQNEPMTETQEMNITNWIPLNYDAKAKPPQNQTRPRPVSVHNPTIPDLRSYLTPASKPNAATTTKKTQVQQTKDETKASRRMSAPIPPLSTSPVSTAAPFLTCTTRPSKAPTARKTSTTTTPILKKNGSTKTLSPSNGATPGSRSGTTTTTTTTTSNTTSANSSSAYRPKQTATVRARAEQAKQRQLQIEEEKRKQAAAAAKLASRNSLRLKQQAPSTVDWEAIKKDRRKTMPAAVTAIGYTS